MKNTNLASSQARAEITFNDPREAFENAINAGFLSSDPDSCVYAGCFMYMHTERNINRFKHIETRKYFSFVQV